MINFEQFPQITEKRVAIHVKPAAERAMRAGHPWVFENAIRKQSHEGQAGDLAVIFDSDRRFLAIGLYDPHSPIRVKVLQHKHPATINADWFTQHLQTAIDRRKPLMNDEQTSGYRLVHGENDGFPGLIMDVYADTVIMKLYSAAWLPHLRTIVPVLQSVHPFARLILRHSRNMNLPSGVHDGQALIGDPVDGPLTFMENGLHFAADVVQGHKTGFFFDQRDNRAEVRTLSNGRSVLDVFAYSGGFSVYAAAGGAQSVTSLDVSGPALAAAQHNMSLNATVTGSTTHQIIVDDAFTALERLHNEGQMFDMVIVDPPTFAKQAAEVDRALVAYERLTRLALGVLDKNGVLVMASCSSRVRPEQFFNTVLRVIDDKRRPCNNLKRTGHALDHPIGFPEGEYLKCLFAEV